jgi:hypothetical protein
VYWFDSAGRIQLEPKDEIKKRGLPSPDLGDALAVTFAQPVHKAELIEVYRQQYRDRSRDFDPYARLQ